MADGFDVVAVGVAHEGPEVARVVLGPGPRLVQHLRPGPDRGLEERHHRGPVGSGEGDVALTEAFARRPGADPEVGHGWDAEADDLAEVEDAAASHRGEHHVVEGGAGRHVLTLDREMVEHVAILAHRRENSLALPADVYQAVTPWLCRGAAATTNHWRTHVNDITTPRRRQRRRPVLAALLLVVPMLLSLVTPAQAAETPGREPPTSAPRPPSVTDLRARAIEEAAARLEKLVEKRGALGVRWDEAKDRLVVVTPATGRGSDISARETAAGAVATGIERKAITRDTVDGINKSIQARRFHPSAVDYSYASHLDLDRGVMIVESDAPADVVAGLVAEFHGAVEVVQGEVRRATRLSDSTPHWGGSSITNGGGTCSSGMPVKNSAGTRFMVTAGHCFLAGQAVWSPGSPYYSWGTVVNRAPFPTWDMELLGGSSYGTYAYTGPVVSNGFKPFLGAGDPVVGFNNYCHSGQTSGEGCGHTVTGLSGQFCDAAGCTPGLITYTGGPMIQPGDSGSPFYVYAGTSGIHARGLNIAYSGATMFAEKWSTIASRFGVTIVT